MDIIPNQFVSCYKKNSKIQLDEEYFRQKLSTNVQKKKQHLSFSNIQNFIKDDKIINRINFMNERIGKQCSLKDFGLGAQTFKTNNFYEAGRDLLESSAFVGPKSFVN